MNTSADENDTATAATPGFIWKQHGDALVCENPERVSVPMPNGTVCHLLVAMTGWEHWVGGYVMAGRKFKHRERLPVDPGAGGAATRAEALRDACEALVDTFSAKEEIYAMAMQKWEQEVRMKGTVDADEIQPAPNPAGRHQWSADGFAQSPERVAVCDLPSVRCAVLLAEAEDGTWRADYELKLGSYRFGKMPSRDVAGMFTSREGALEATLEHLARKFEHEDVLVNEVARVLCELAATASPVSGSRLFAQRIRENRLRILRDAVHICDLCGPASCIVAGWADLQAGSLPDEKFQARHAVEVIAPSVGNVLRVEIPVPEGYRCSLLLFTPQGAAGIFPGYFYSSPDGMLDVMVPDEETRGGPHGGPWMARDVALEHACGALFDAIEDDDSASANVIRDALRDWVMGQGEESEREISGGAPAGIQSTAPAESSGVADHGGLGSHVVAVANPPEENASPSNFAPSTAPVLPGMAHEVNEAGVFVNPEVITVPMPKRTALEIRLAQAPDGTWRIGMSYGLDGDKPGNGHAAWAPNINDKYTYPERSAALLAALGKAEDEFKSPALDRYRKLADRAVEAIFAFRKDLVPPRVAGSDPVPMGIPAPAVAKYKTEFAEIPLAKIQPNPENHRKHYDPIADREMAESLRSEGLHQPIAVRRLLDGEAPAGEMPLGDASAPEYELIFGHRRRRGAIIAGMTAIQSKIYYGLTRKQGVVIALIENLQRENINAMEEAEGYADLIAAETLTQEACADRVSVSRSHVAKCMQLLRLPEGVRDQVRALKLTQAHGSALARFVPAEEEGRKEFPAWEMVVKIMAEEAVENKAPAGAMERGVPSAYKLCAAGLAVRVSDWGEDRIEPKFKKHAAYFQTEDGDWICFAPAHWAEELKRRAEERAAAEAAATAARLAEMAKIAAGGRRQLKLADLNPADYRQMDAAHEALLSLVPDGKKQAAKGEAGRTTVVTDVELADRLTAAMQREMKNNRKACAAALMEKIEKRIAKIKKVGPREFAWLAFLVVDEAGRQCRINLTRDAAKAAGEKLPSGVCGLTTEDWNDQDLVQRHQRNRLTMLGKHDGAAILRVMFAEAAPRLVDEVIANGPDGSAGRVLKWWLDTETLWLLEETPEGRDELVETVKGSAWYQKALAGGVGGEGEES